MVDPDKPSQKKPNPIRLLNEQVDGLVEELSFAFQYQRPSIILMIRESEYMQGMLELALEKRLVEIGKQVVPFYVDERNFDIPMLLSLHPDRERSVYSVAGLSKGGGKKGANAYRALNIRRELFVDYSIRVVIWLEKNEEIELSRHAPDFWAFRHRVISLPDAIYPEPFLKKGVAVAKQLNRLAWLAKFWECLASMYADSDQHNRSIRAYWKAIRSNPQDDGLLDGLGRVYLYQGRLESAREVYKRAVQINPKSVSAWINLGHLYRRGGRFSDAIIAYQHAAKLVPHDTLARSMLVACYRLSGMDDQVEEQSEVVRQILKPGDYYQQAVFESALGNGGQALTFLASALEKGQVQAADLHRDPNLDLIREDERFKQLGCPG